MSILKHLTKPTSTFYFSKGANIVQPSLALLQLQQHRLMAQKQTPAFISELENKTPTNSKYLKRPRIFMKNGNDSEVSFHESDSDYENAQMIFTKQKNKKLSTNNIIKISTSSPKLPKFSSNVIAVPKAHLNNFESESSDLDIINNFSAKCEQYVMDPVELSDNSDIESAEEFYSSIFKSQSQSNHKSTRFRKTGTQQEYNFEESIFDSSSKETPDMNADMKEILQDKASTNHLLDAMALFSTENEPEAPKEKSIVSEPESTMNELAPSSKKSVRSIVNNLKASLQNPSMAKGTDDKKMFFLTQRSNTVDAISREGSDIPKLADDAKSTRKVLTANILSDEQRKVVELAKLGANIFYTGAAGTGKSVLLRAMIKELKSNFEPGEIVVTASTGLAACNIGGITLHSFAGIGLGSETPDFLLKRVRKSKTSRERWQTAKLLIIDEISMIDAELLDKLDYIARNIKKKVEPFGGIQLIFCGDFFQLPPVVKNNETHVPGSFNDGSAPVGDRMTKHFAFNSKLWKDAIKYTIVLQKVFRQKGDLEFIEMLNEIRQGEVSNKTEEEFRKLARKLNLGNNIVPTQLYPTRREVEISNNDRLTSLTGEATHYQATEGGTLLDKVKRKKILDNFLAVDELKLKPGAQVMMIKNIDSTLVNGSLGKVICFMNRETYAVSLSKGSNYSDSDSVFDFIEKPTSEENSQQHSNCTRKIKIHKDLKRENRDILLPLVRFFLPDGSTRSILVEPEEWVYEDELQKPLVTKVQLPLILAWSLSIHKSQGLTLPFCTVDLSRIFEKGQAYVALSRAVSRSGLQVLNFRRDKIFSHKSVLEFYKTLSSANEAILAFTEDMAKKKKSILSEVSKPSALKKKPAQRSKATNKEPNDPLQRSLEFFGMVKRERPDLNLDVLDDVSSLNTPAEESKVTSQNIEIH